MGQANALLREAEFGNSAQGRFATTPRTLKRVSVTSLRPTVGQTYLTVGQKTTIYLNFRHAVTLERQKVGDASPVIRVVVRGPVIERIG